MTVLFDDNNSLDIQRIGGHLYITICALYANNDIDGTEISFILDTGAFITVISRDIANRFGYNKLPKVPGKIKGYSGEASADFVRIPGLKILDPFIFNVPVLIPHSTDLKQNILGLNVLEYFNYFINTANDKIYFSENPSPRHYNPLLASGGVFDVHPDC